MATKKSSRKVVERRKNAPRKRPVNERRGDMKIITSASQGDIYVWAVSLVVMAIILVTTVLITVLKG